MLPAPRGRPRHAPTSSPSRPARARRGQPALAYAASLEQPLLVLQLRPGEDEARRFRREWETFGVPVPIEIVVSPQRALVAPRLRAALRREPRGVITAIAFHLPA